MTQNSDPIDPQEAIAAEMDVNASPAAPAAQPPVSEETLKLQASFKSGANWFYWIAGLSLVNTIIILSGNEWSFIIGLAITLMADVVAREIGGAAIAVGLAFDVIVAGIFVLFGYFALKGRRWAFAVGMILYGLDGLIMLIMGDYFAFGFHLFALWCIYVGVKAGRQLKQMGISLTD